MTASQSSPALVLFAHGARDPRWAEPFEQLAARVRALRGADGGPVALAYLELMKPTLEQVVADYAAAGHAEVTVVPVFLGQGGHLRRDLPALLEQCRVRHPQLTIRCTAAIGEAKRVLDAMADFCLEAGAPGGAEAALALAPAPDSWR